MASEIPEQAEEKAGDTPQTSEFLLKVAAESIVLMKNEKSVLPLSCERTVSIFTDKLFSNTNYLILVE